MGWGGVWLGCGRVGWSGMECGGFGHLGQLVRWCLAEGTGDPLRGVRLALTVYNDVET